MNQIFLIAMCSLLSFAASASHYQNPDVLRQRVKNYQNARLRNLDREIAEAETDFQRELSANGGRRPLPPGMLEELRHASGQDSLQAWFQYKRQKNGSYSTSSPVDNRAVVTDQGFYCLKTSATLMQTFTYACYHQNGASYFGFTSRLQSSVSQ